MPQAQPQEPVSQPYSSFVPLREADLTAGITNAKPMWGEPRVTGDCVGNSEEITHTGEAG